MTLVKKETINRSIITSNRSMRPPTFELTFNQAKDNGEEVICKQWFYITPNGSLVELGRVIHSWLRHGLIPSGASEIKQQQGELK